MPVLGHSTMNFGFLSNLPWFKAQSNTDSKASSISRTDPIPQPKLEAPNDVKLSGYSWTASTSSSALIKQPKLEVSLSSNVVKVSGWFFSLQSIFPWAGGGNGGGKGEFRRPSTINRDLKRRAQGRGVVEKDKGVTAVRFRPYVGKVPWHTGVRGFLSQLFPRYGHYCGPNWSSGKDGGSLIWDKRPIDWLDFCCYCHDIGYDTHDQAKLLEADLAFLECLEKPHMSTKGDPRIALLYKTMCINGLRNFLIPYRRYFVKLQSRQPFIQFERLCNLRWKRWCLQKNS